MEIVLSEKAIEWVYQNGQPVANYQFIGYMFCISKKIGGVVDINGKWGIYYRILDKNGIPKKLKKKAFNKEISTLIKRGFLVKIEESPFPEFEYYHALKIDVSKLQYVNEKIFD